jgi:copper chaperone CopZ
VEWAGKNKLLYVKVDGMTCGHCVNTVQKAISSLKGVRHVAVSLDQRIAAIATDPHITSLDTFHRVIVDAVEDVGFGAEMYSGSSRDIIIPAKPAVAVSTEVSIEN